MAKLKPVQVKICGITNVDDARWVVNLGGDFVGLNFCAESPRKVSVEKAAEVAASLPPFVKSVGVFINPEIKELEKILKKVPLGALQLHGDEPLEFLPVLKSQFRLPIWKAVRVENEESLKRISDYAGIADVLLLDTYKPGQAGGTGESFDWNLAVSAKQYGIPVFLAGGLKPENVVEAIQTAEPVGVDAASGVEKEGRPKKKDLDKLKLFIQRAKGMMK